MAGHRFVFAKNGAKDIGLPLSAFWIFSYRISKAAWYAGPLRQSREDFYENGKKDMKALNILIGTKKYVFSDTKPSDIDCVLFGTVAQILYNDKGPFNQYLNSDCQNLLRHTLNMKQIYWPDWEENTLLNKQRKTK